MGSTGSVSAHSCYFQHVLRWAYRIAIARWTLIVREKEGKLQYKRDKKDYATQKLAYSPFCHAFTCIFVLPDYNEASSVAI